MLLFVEVKIFLEYPELHTVIMNALSTSFQVFKLSKIFQQKLFLLEILIILFVFTPSPHATTNHIEIYWKTTHLKDLLVLTEQQVIKNKMQKTKNVFAKWSHKCTVFLFGKSNIVSSICTMSTYPH